MGDKPNNDDGGRKPKWASLFLSLIGTVMGLASFFAVFALMLANLHEKEPSVAEGELSPSERIRQQQVEDQRKLTTYELIDKQNGVWRIPIEVAMEKMIAEGQAKWRNHP
jgi:hypothetical protein